MWRQYQRQSRLAAWPRSATLIVASAGAAAAPAARAPSTSVMNCQLGSV